LSSTHEKHFFQEERVTKTFYLKSIARVLFSVVNQLELTFEVVGTPTEEEMGRIPKSKENILHVVRRVRPRKDFSKLFKDTTMSPEVIDILEKILIFDHQRRLDSESALKHPYFAQWHDPDDEPVGERLVNMEFEENCKGIEDIKNLLWEQAKYYTANDARQTQIYKENMRKQKENARRKSLTKNKLPEESLADKRKNEN